MTWNRFKDDWLFCLKLYVKSFYNRMIHPKLTYCMVATGPSGWSYYYWWCRQ